MPNIQNAVVQNNLRWYAIHTRPRHEKRVSHQLQEKGFITYLPVLNEVHYWSDRRKSVDVPFFAGYCFVRMLESSTTRLPVLRTPGVIDFLGKGLSGAIPDKQIEDIHTALAQGSACIRHPFLRVGQRVRVRGGALDGVEGILLDLRGNRSLVISVDSILQSLAICIEGYDIEILRVSRSNAA